MIRIVLKNPANEDNTRGLRRVPVALILGVLQCSLIGFLFFLYWINR